MAQIPPLLMVEPAAGQRRAAGIVARRESPLDLESIKTQLGEIRRHCRDNQASLMEEYKKNVVQFAGVEWTVAPDAAQAASYIKQVAGRTDLVSINKSNVVVNELRPQLQAAGLQTFVRYFKEFDAFEKKTEDYWGLSGFHEKGMVESFDVARTFTHLESGQVRDYIAVVGVNAVSAADGSAFFLQHMSNISKDLQQAKKIVIVVCPEKIVKDRAAALLQTRSMGVFGLESILLDLGPKEVENFDFEGLPTIAADRQVFNPLSRLPKVPPLRIGPKVACLRVSSQVAGRLMLSGSGRATTRLGRIHPAPPIEALRRTATVSKELLDRCLSAMMTEVKPVKPSSPACFPASQFHTYDQSYSHRISIFSLDNGVRWWENKLVTLSKPSSR